MLARVFYFHLYKACALALLIWNPALLFADSRVFYAKIEPLERYELRASIHGVVHEAKKAKEGSYIDAKEVIIHLDDTLERKILAHQEVRLKSMQERVRILSSTLQLKERHFRDIQSLSTKSSHQKDNEEIALFNAKISYLQALEQLEILKTEYAQNLDAIDKKSLKIAQKYLYKIHVKTGEYVNVGTLLAEVMDISGAKVTLFISKDEAESLHKKQFYIDGIATKVLAKKLYKVADAEHISEYRLELQIPAREIFSQLVKIEIRD